MAGTFSNLFNPTSGEAAGGDTERPFEPGPGEPAPDTPKGDGDGPPPEIASGLEGSSDGDFAG